MACKVELTPAALRDLNKLDPQIARRLPVFLHDRLVTLDDPRSLGAALKGSKLGEYWKYRVGDYRIISSIQDDQSIIIVVVIGHRREACRKA